MVFVGRNGCGRWRPVGRVLRGVGLRWSRARASRARRDRNQFRDRESRNAGRRRLAVLCPLNHVARDETTSSQKSPYGDPSSHPLSGIRSTILSLIRFPILSLIQSTISSLIRSTILSLGQSIILSLIRSVIPARLASPRSTGGDCPLWATRSQKL